MKDSKTLTYILIIVVLALILGLIIKFAIFDNDDNTPNTTSTNQEVVTESSNVEIKDKRGDDEYSDYTAEINLSLLEVTGTGISVSDSTITVTEEGVYCFTGELNDGNIVVNADDDANVVLVFDNASITSNGTAVINGVNAKNIYINLKEGFVNTFTDSSTYTEFTSDDEPNATIFSKTDLLICGKGTLIVNANYEDAIASKDELVITNATLTINAVDDGIRGKDCVDIKDANITINSKGDGIKSTNDSDTEKGYIIIDGGSINITSSDDAINAISSVVINSGEITISSGDDGIHADGMIEINGGTFNITAAEGIEATYVKINDGTINISASDDGINAGSKSNSYSVTIEINGGYITIKMGQGDTDGIDSNGNLYINGGTVDITANSPFDYDGTAKLNGGTIIVNGTQTNTITNQMMGGGNMNSGMQGNGMQGPGGQGQMRMH